MMYFSPLLDPGEGSIPVAGCEVLFNWTKNVHIRYCMKEKINYFEPGGVISIVKK